MPTIQRRPYLSLSELAGYPMRSDQLLRSMHKVLSHDLPNQTVVVYMGAGALPVIARQLIGHGLPAAMPVALIENGTTDHERRVVGTLATIERQALRARLDGPTLCIVGEVVGLALARSVDFRFESRIGLW